MPANIDVAMLEMFRAEVETHMTVLNDGLLALEKIPGRRDRCEALMRAAHSIKGAAKIVGLPAAVAVAHAIEDSFVAVGAGRVGMTSELVDVLLQGVDLLGRAAEVDDAGRATLEVDDPQIAKINSRLAEAMSGNQKVVRAAQDTAAASGAAQACEPAEFYPRGRLDAEWSMAHRDRVVSLLRSEVPLIRFDLSDVTSIDAAGLAFLALAARAANQQGLKSKIQIDGVNTALERLLHAAGLGSLCRLARVEE